jgi:para-aminobenzoate synthetase/4-amino-4-deoxychorismate lyase
MTSTVTARLKAGTSFANVVRALFPCGSITGAPKHRAMQIIASLESTPRGLYTGAIGWLDAPRPGTRHACGDFCLSVAIRTLCLQAPHAHDMRAARIGIGAGIVLDSRCDDEYEECYLKARFLTGLDPGLTLFETIRASRSEGAPYLDRHLARLANGARRLGFACEPATLRAAVLTQIGELPDDAEYRLRLVLAHDGKVSITHAPLRPLPPGPVKILLAQDLGFAATEASDALLGFKSSRRADYDKAWQQAEALGGFDAIFINTRGELTEGGRSNLFVKLAGRWWTPPLASGVLPGVMRAVLLEDPQWGATERVLLPADLDAAEALVVSNALRAAVPAQLMRNLP